MKPLLIFGLRGTLIERIFSRDVTNAMPQHHLMVGLHKVWLRPRMLQTLYALQPHCRLAIWSSTTARNTTTLMDAIFNNKVLLQQHLGATYDPSASLNKQTENVSSSDGMGASQMSSTTLLRTPDGVSSAFARAPGNSEVSNGGAAAASLDASRSSTTTASAAWTSPFKFEFVWTREHTAPDDFRRLYVQESSDEYATIKDLGRVFTCFPQISQPHNTVLIDDTPSKAKKHSDNFLWLDTCQGLFIQQDKGESMDKLYEWVMREAIPASDIRTLLPSRISVSEQHAV